MKRISKLTILGGFALLIAGALMISSCEGPVGPAGAAGTNGTDGTDGTNGIDGNVTCLGCHNTENQAEIATEFAASQHASGDIAVSYAGGRGGSSACAACHSHEGYLEFARTGGVANNFTNPSPWICATCHDLHTDFADGDYAFRLGDPVALVADETVVIDGGNNNTCINCHQSRRLVSDYDDVTKDTTYTRRFTGDDIDVYTTAAWGPGGSATLVPTGDTLVVAFVVPTLTHAYISSTHAGPHHGPQANLWHGEAAGTVDGTPYASHADGCVSCHMGPESGHSFHPVDGNCIDCHGSKGTEMDAVAARLEAIAHALEAIHAIHIDESWKTGESLFGAAHPVYASLERDDFNAWWNFTLIMEDRSLSAHNPTYVKTLLNSIEATLGIGP